MTALNLQMKFNAVIFDIDNVLIDTRASYTDCIIKTVTTYLETILKFQPSRSPLLTRKDVEAFKSLGGFNDDWDTCYGLLIYFLHFKISRRKISELIKQKNIQALRSKISPPSFPPTKMGGGRWGVSGIEKLLGKHPEVNLKRIADIFQRFYLSDFVWNESLIIPESFLKQLKKSGIKIGIVTGRSREEANFALRRFQIDRYINAMITVDETPVKFKKPHPYGLLKVAAMLGKNLNFIYIGDLPDDVLAAKEAKKKIKISSCGFLKASSQPEEMKREFKKLKTDYIFRNVKELAGVLLKGTL